MVGLEYLRGYFFKHKRIAIYQRSSREVLGIYFKERKSIILVFLKITIRQTYFVYFLQCLIIGFQRPRLLFDWACQISTNGER